MGSEIPDPLRNDLLNRTGSRDGGESHIEKVIETPTWGLKFQTPSGMTYSTEAGPYKGTIFAKFATKMLKSSPNWYQAGYHGYSMDPTTSKTSGVCHPF